MMQETAIRNKELTSQQLESLRSHPQFLQTNKSEFVLYNLVNKESNSGLFKNQRLLILDIVGQSICYLSKVPAGLIPFQKYQQVKDQQPKQSISQKEIYEDNVNKFTCQKLDDKNAIEIKLTKKDRKVQWVYYFANKDVMNQWYTHLSFLFLRTRKQIDQFYHSVQQPSHTQELSPQKSQYKPQNQSVIHELNDSKVNQSLNKNSALKEQYLKPPSQVTPLHQSQKSIKPKSEKNQKFESNQNDLLNKNEESSNYIKNKEVDSQFKQFDQHTPLGSFLRQDVQQSEKKPSNSHHIYSSSQYNKNKQSRRQVGTIKQESLQNSKKQIIKNNNSFNQNPQPKESSLSGLEYRPISRHTRLNQQENNRERSSDKWGSIKKQSQVSIKSESPSKHKKWNNIYQSSINKSQIYFEFVQESIKNGMNLVNNVNSNKKPTQINRSEAYSSEVLNGIQYIIGFKYPKEQMLLYQTSDQHPLVYDLYDEVRQFKQQFYELKQRFRQEDYQDPQPLAILLEYKLVSVLCRSFDDKQRSYHSSRKRTQNFFIQDQLLQKMQLGQINITSTLDFRHQMRKKNISSLNWSYLYKNSKSKYLQQIFLAQIFCQIFLNMLRSELYHIYANLPLAQQKSEINNLDNILIKCTLNLIQRLFAQIEKAKEIWELLKSQCQRVFKISGLREDVNENYLLFAILQNTGLQNLSQKIKISNKMLPLISYWSKSNEVRVSFKPIVNCLQYQQMTKKIRQIASIITQNKFQYHKQLLAFRDEAIQQIPQQINYIILEINLALTSTLSQKVSLSREIYQIIHTQQPSSFLFLTALSKIKWLLNDGCDEEAIELASENIGLIIYYVGKNPLLVKYYEAFSTQQLKQNQYEKAIANIKRQIEILNDSLGIDCEPALLKKMQLSDAYFQINKRDDCLRELNQSRKICEVNKNTESGIYKSILAKLSKLALNMGKYNDCINNTLVSLKQLQKEAPSNSRQSQAKALQFLKVIQLLSRAFELGKRKEQQLQVVKLSIQRCKQVHSYKVYSKLFKITLYPYLKKLALIQSQALLDFIEKLLQLNLFVKMSQKQLLSMVQKTNLLVKLEQKILSQLKSLKILNEKISNQRIFQKLNSMIQNNDQQITEKGEPYQFIIEWLLIVKILTPAFVQAILKDSYYQ